MTGILHTRDGTEALIKLIHQEDTLWNIQADDYTKKEMRDTSMIRVAESLGVTGMDTMLIYDIAL